MSDGMPDIHPRVRGTWLLEDRFDPRTLDDWLTVTSKYGQWVEVLLGLSARVNVVRRAEEDGRYRGSYQVRRWLTELLAIQLKDQRLTQATVKRCVSDEEFRAALLTVAIVDLRKARELIRITFGKQVARRAPSRHRS